MTMAQQNATLEQYRHHFIAFDGDIVKAHSNSNACYPDALVPVLYIHYLLSSPRVAETVRSPRPYFVGKDMIFFLFVTVKLQVFMTCATVSAAYKKDRAS